MTRTSLKISHDRKKENAAKQFTSGKKVKYPTRVYNRCANCGKIRGYMRRFGICRICFRELAREGKIAGVTKSSW